MSNTRKPINDPFGDNRPAVKLPPLPSIQAEGTMAPSSQSSDSQNTDHTDQPEVKPVTPPTSTFKPLPPRPDVKTPVIPPVNQPVSVTPTRETEEPAEPNYEADALDGEVSDSDNMFDLSDDMIDDDFEDEEEILISEDEDILLQRLFYSMDPAIPAPTIYALLDDDEVEDEVLEALAANPNTPDEFLVKLSTHSNDFVRQAVMENKSISDELYMSFVNDPEVMVIAAMVENPRTTSEVARVLMNHPDNYIRFLLKEKSQMLTVAEKEQIVL